MKVPTAILYHKENDTFIPLEYSQNAINKMKDITSENDYVLLKGFKMKLKDVSFNGVPVKKALKDYFTWIKKVILSVVQAQCPDINIDTVQKRWCITCPAMWDEEDKQVTVQAAIDSGMVSANDPVGKRELVLVLEPEAAAAHFVEYTKDKQLHIEGKHVLVVDGGAGTVDLTIHKLSANAAEEAFPGCGHKFAGNSVNEEFLAQLVKHVDNYEAFKKLKKSAFSLSENIEKAKCNIKTLTLKKYMLDVPPKITEKWKSLQDNWECFDQDNSIEFPGTVWENSWKECLSKTTMQINEIFKTLQDSNVNLDYVYLVGGLSSSPIFQNSVKDACKGRKVQVFHPENPEISIVSGTITFGLNPTWIGSRVVNYTYGFEVLEPWNQNKHAGRDSWEDPQTKEKFCTKVFSLLVTRGEKFCYNDKVVKTITAPSTSVKKIKVAFFRVDQGEKAPNYIDSSMKVKACGSMIMSLSNNENSTNTSTAEVSTKITLELFFGRPCVEARVINPLKPGNYFTVELKPQVRLNIRNHVIFVIDVSGSMRDVDITPISFGYEDSHNYRLGAVFQACEKFIRQRVDKQVTSPKFFSTPRKSFVQLPFLANTPSSEKFSMIKFSDFAELVFAKQDLKWGNLFNYVENITPDGGTNYVAALECVIPLLADDELNPVVIFLSDGEPSNMKEDIDLVLGRIIQVGCTVHTVLVGNQAGEAILKDIASKSGGEFAHCTDLDKLVKAFVIVAGKLI